MQLFEERLRAKCRSSLKRTLQKLDKTLRTHPVDQHGTLTLADIARSPLPSSLDDTLEDIDEMAELIRKLDWPDRIPEAYLQAYSSVLNGRHFTNCGGSWHGLSFSSFLSLLPTLDRLCNTALTSTFRAAQARVRPFPFMRLPLELRQLVYEELDQDHGVHRLINPHLFLGYSPFSATSRQLHSEYAQSYFRTHPLLLDLIRDPTNEHRSNYLFACVYENLLNMHQLACQHIVNLEICFGHFTNYCLSDARRRFPDFYTPRYIYDDNDDVALRALLSLIPNVKSITILFPRLYKILPSPQAIEVTKQRENNIAWLRRCIPAGTRLLWDMRNIDYRVQFSGEIGKEHELYLRQNSLIEKLGPVEQVRSICNGEHNLGEEEYYTGFGTTEPLPDLDIQY